MTKTQKMALQEIEEGLREAQLLVYQVFNNLPTSDTAIQRKEKAERATNLLARAGQWVSALQESA